MAHIKGQKSNLSKKQSSKQDIDQNTENDNVITEKEPTKKAVTKKEPTKKEPTKKEPTKKEPTKKEPTKKEPTKKESTKKEPTTKEPTTTKKAVTKKEPTKKEPTEAEKEPRKRTVPTKESVSTEFDELISFIEEEISRIRESQVKSKGVKFLRCIGKRIKMIRGHAFRVLKEKKKTNRKNNTNSGFLKPVNISKEMALFTGWDQNELKSRVDVTKYICNYIRDNDLQNPKDRRQIIVDNKLSKLLDFDPNVEKEPLTYYRIQSYIKKHFSNPVKNI